MKWRNAYVAIMCICILNSGTNGALLTVFMGTAPVLLSTAMLLVSPVTILGEAVVPRVMDSEELTKSFALLGGPRLGNGVLGRLAEVILDPQLNTYNGPGSVAITTVAQFRDIALNVLRLWNRFFANIFSFIRFVALTGWRIINTILASIPRVLSRRLRSGRFRLTDILLRNFGSGRLRNAAQTGAIIAEAAGTGSLRARTALGGSGGPLRKILNAIRMSVVNSMKESARFRLLQFRNSLRQIPRDIINGARNAKDNVFNAATAANIAKQKLQSAVSRLRNGLLGSLVRLPINILKNIVGRIVNALKNQVAKALSVMAPSPLKHFLKTGPIRRVLGALGKLKDIASRIAAPLKKVISAVRNLNKNIRSRIRELLKDIIVAFVVSRAKLPTGLLPHPLRRLSKALSRVVDAGKKLANGLTRVFGQGLIGIVRRILGAGRNAVKNALMKIPTPRNILRNLLNRLRGGGRLVNRIRTALTNTISLISILGNLRARRAYISSSIRQDIRQIREGLRSIVLSLLSSISTRSSSGGIIKRVIVSILSRAGSRRPSAIKLLTNIINSVTGILQGGTQGGLIGRIRNIINSLRYVFEPLMNANLGLG